MVENTMLSINKKVIIDMIDFRDEIMPYIRDKYDVSFCELFEELPKGPFAGWLIRLAMEQIRTEIKGDE